MLKFDGALAETRMTYDKSSVHIRTTKISHELLSSIRISTKTDKYPILFNASARGIVKILHIFHVLC